MADFPGAPPCLRETGSPQLEPRFETEAASGYASKATSAAGRTPPALDRSQSGKRSLAPRLTCELPASDHARPISCGCAH